MTYRDYKLLLVRAVTKYWPAVLLFWLLCLVILRASQPNWADIARDGDFEFLPSDLPSRIGQKMLDEAFPQQRARSRIALIIARESEELDNADLSVAFDLGRRISQLAASTIIERLGRTTNAAGGDLASTESNRLLETRSKAIVKSLLDNSIQLDGLWYSAMKVVAPDRDDLLKLRWLVSYQLRAELLETLGDDEAALADRELLELLTEQSAREAPSRFSGVPPKGDDLNSFRPVIDVWTWDDPFLGSKLGEGNANARMIVLQLESEFMSVQNVAVTRVLEDMIQGVLERHRPFLREGLEVGVSGPAAVGSDMLQAAALGVKQTEWITIGLVLGILCIIYRSPLLVLIPMLTIGFCLSITMSVVSLLAAVPDQSNPFGLLKVFTTTRIFIVVLLFGIGTDFCLFLISRCREGLLAETRRTRTRYQRTIAGSLYGVHDAIMGSALTTSFGLLLMVFSSFEKFRYNGIIICIAVLITLAVCLTLPAAILAGIGPTAFWPRIRRRSPDRSTFVENGWIARFWNGIASIVLGFPRFTLAAGLIVLLAPAVHGMVQGRNVTYDFLSELSRTAPSRQGAELIDRHFSTRDNSPVTIVVTAPSPFESERHLRESIDKLRLKLYFPGVVAVRTLTDPLGDFPPDKRMGLFGQEAWRRRMLENHRLTQSIYVSTQRSMLLRSARLDVILEDDPFSSQAEQILRKVAGILEGEVTNPESPWYQAEFGYSGTTAGIADLKETTQSDQFRIQILVTLGVWAILYWLLRRPWLSAYLMFTVIVSYFATLGLTHWFFEYWAIRGGEDFHGLDWKVPLLLFVILVAVGQDYNVYLTTRVYEEQSSQGPIVGLRRGIVSTGGIITSCGVVMAATFFSMTGGSVSAWMHEMGFPSWLGAAEQPLLLRGIVELGFALGLGVLLDTFVVRSFLVPAMLAWTTRCEGRPMNQVRPKG